LSASIFCAGCSATAPVPEPPTAQHIRLVTTAYLQYADKHGRAPRDANALKPILQEMGCDPNEALRSERDQEPLVILWDVQDLPAVAARRKKSVQIKSCVLVYEQRGQNGRRYVGFSNSFVKEMAEQDLAKARFPANHRFH
jgi:hypothetical protein